MRAVDARGEHYNKVSPCIGLEKAFVITAFLQKHGFVTMFCFYQFCIGIKLQRSFTY